MNDTTVRCPKCKSGNLRVDNQFANTLGVAYTCRTCHYLWHVRKDGNVAHQSTISFRIPLTLIVLLSIFILAITVTGSAGIATVIFLFAAFLLGGLLHQLWPLIKKGQAS